MEENNIKTSKNFSMPKKTLIITTIIIAITSVSALAFNIFSSPESKLLSLFTKTFKQIEKEYSESEKIHEKNLPLLYNKNLNEVVLGFRYGIAGTDFPLTKLTLLTSNDDKSQVTLDVEDTFNAVIKSNDEMSTLNFGGNDTYGVAHKTFKEDATKWLSENNLDQYIEYLDYFDENLDTNNDFFNSEDVSELTRLFKDFLLSGNLSLKNDENDKNIKHYVITLSAERFKQLLTTIAEMNRENIESLIAANNEDYTYDYFIGEINNISNDDIVITITGTNGIISKINLYSTFEDEPVNLGIAIKDISKIINGMTLYATAEDGEKLELVYEAENFNKDLLQEKFTLLSNDEESFSVDFNYKFEKNSATYNNGTISINFMGAEIVADSTLAIIDSKLYIDFTLPSTYEMFLGKGMMFLTFSENNSNIELSQPTSNLFDHTVMELFLSEKDNLLKLVEKFKFY